jgi:hypothetical protein
MDGDRLPQTSNCLKLFATYPKDEFRVLDTALERQADVDIIAEKIKNDGNKDKKESDLCNDESRHGSKRFHQKLSSGIFQANTIFYFMIRVFMLLIQYHLNYVATYGTL